MADSYCVARIVETNLRSVLSWISILAFTLTQELCLFTSFSFNIFILASQVSEDFKYEAEKQDCAKDGNGNRIHI